MSGLTVRSFERREIDLPVEFVIAESHRQQVRFSPASGAEHMFTLRARAVDISHGGMGLATRHFIPRMCEGMLRIYRRSDAAAPDAPASRDPVFEHRVKVRRITMTGHEPQYLVGLAFVDPDPDLDQRVLSVLGLEGPGASAPASREERAHA